MLDKNSTYVNGFWLNGKVYRCPIKRKAVATYDWGGVEVRVPIPFEAALVSLYGKDWRLPFPRKWEWSVDPFRVGSCVNSKYPDTH